MQLIGKQGISGKTLLLAPLALGFASRRSTRASPGRPICWSTAISKAQRLAAVSDRPARRLERLWFDGPRHRGDDRRRRRAQRLAWRCVIAAPHSPRPTSTSTRSLPVQKNTIYEVSAFVRWEGKLRPILSVARMDWKPLGLAVCRGARSGPKSAWRSTRSRTSRCGWSGFPAPRASSTRPRPAAVISTTSVSERCQSRAGEPAAGLPGRPPEAGRRDCAAPSGRPARSARRAAAADRLPRTACCGTKTAAKWPCGASICKRPSRGNTTAG